MIFNRIAEHVFRGMMQKYPVMTIMGPRQSGKTTLAETVCIGYPYFNLEDPKTREIILADPREFFKRYSDGVILDEIQHAPILLSYIQPLVDKKKKNGLYILTGSHQPEIHEAISQSLAGRTAILELLPLCIAELNNNHIVLSQNEFMLQGFYPKIYHDQLNATDVHRDYVKTYLERDVRKLINLKDLLLFQRFMKLCAARTGTILNYHNLSNEVGVSHHTISHWMSVLKASYLIDFVPPYFENINKRVIKSPKMYFTDVGLAAYLLEIESVSQIDYHPLRGQLFETMVANELMKTRFNQGREHHLYYYRDSQKNEVDLIYKKGAELIPIEIKSSHTFSTDFLKGINTFLKLNEGTKNICGQSYLVYAGDEEFSIKDTRVIHYTKAASIVVG